MTDWDESDSAYVRGRIDGFLHGLAWSSDQHLAFDQEQWEDRYGSRVVYDSFPAWASKAERKRNENPIVLCDWVDSTETLYLKDGVSLPLDRSGTIVFEDGLVVISSSESPQMFTSGIGECPGA
jgi:hypothetical protein